MSQERTGDYSPKGVGYGGNAEIHDRTGLYLAILAFGIACASISVNVMQYVSYSEIKTHVMLMDDAFQRWKMWAETHGFPEPEKGK